MRYQESYKLINQVYQQELQNIKVPHEVHARALIQMSRAELGLGKVEEALKHATEAIQFFEEDFKRSKLNIPVNWGLATAYIAKANALAANDMINDAFLNYDKGYGVYSS